MRKVNPWAITEFAAELIYTQATITDRDCTMQLLREDPRFFGLSEEDFDELAEAVLDMIPKALVVVDWPDDDEQVPATDAERIAQLERQVTKWRYTAENRERTIAAMHANWDRAEASSKATIRRCAALLDRKRKTLPMEALRLALNPEPSTTALSEDVT